jgi:hypothetical protein
LLLQYFGKKFFGGKSATTLQDSNATEYNNYNPENKVVRYTTNHDVNLSDGTPLELFGWKKKDLLQHL